MISHEYRGACREVVTRVGGPWAVVAGFALAMALLAWRGWLPRPWPALDTDRVILLHQAEASRSAGAAELLLLGDSSCLMNVEAVRLGERLGIRVLNLGTLSYLDLESNGRLLAEYARAHPGGPREVVLLLHPQRLRLPGSADGYHAKVLRHYLAGEDYFGDPTARGWLDRWLGLERWRGRVLARGLPRPLTGAYRERYGFTHDLWRWLDQHGGSLVDPYTFDPDATSGSAEYRLAAGVEAEGAAFRRLVPAHTRLWVGLTPVPERQAGREHDAGEALAALLERWATVLAPAEPLRSLPLVLPDDGFASLTHLNAAGRESYTERLGAELGARLAGISHGEIPALARPPRSAGSLSWSVPWRESPVRRASGPQASLRFLCCGGAVLLAARISCEKCGLGETGRAASAGMRGFSSEPRRPGGGESVSARARTL